MYVMCYTHVSCVLQGGNVRKGLAGMQEYTVCFLCEEILDIKYGIA